MENWILALTSGFVGAVSGGLLCAWGSVKAVRAAQRDLEFDEVRRQRVECLVNLMGLRFTLTGQLSLASAEDKSRMMFELNRAVALWSDNASIIEHLARIRTSSSVENITRMLRLMSEGTSLSFMSLSEDDLSTPFQVR
jgi:hypothetical protein